MKKLILQNETIKIKKAEDKKRKRVKYHIKNNLLGKIHVKLSTLDRMTY